MDVGWWVLSSAQPLHREAVAHSKHRPEDATPLRGYHEKLKVELVLMYDCGAPSAPSLIHKGLLQGGGWREVGVG